MRETRHSLAWSRRPSVAAWFSILALGALAAACGDNRAESSAQPTVQPVERGPSTVVAEGSECEPGEVQGCSVDFGIRNGIHTCFAGEQTCSADGEWGDCITFDIVGPDGSASGGAGQGGAGTDSATTQGGGPTASAPLLSPPPALG